MKNQLKVKPLIEKHQQKDGKGTGKLNLYKRTNNLGETEYIYQETPDSEEILLTPTNKRFSNDPTNWDYKDANGREYSPRMVKSPHPQEELYASGEPMGPLEKYVAELNWRAKNNPASIALQGKYTMPAIASTWLAPLGQAFAGSTIAGVPATTWANTAMAAGFAGHGLNHAVNEGINGWGDAAMTAMEVTPLGKLARPMWNASKKGLQYTAKVADATARYISPSYDLHRTISETTPRTTPTYHSFYSSDLTGSGLVENVHTGSPLFEFGQTMRTSPEKAYFMRTPKNVDILKLRNGRFRHEVVGNETLPSGEVNGKFVSYGEPWQEFTLGENSALYEFPVGPRRGPNLMATDWKGRSQRYSVDEAYNYMQQERALRRELDSIKKTIGDDEFLKQYYTIRRNLIDKKYPILDEPINTSVYGANQTVIPNDRWNFDKFLKTPFWRYSENPISGQVQKELMMKWPEAKFLETPTIKWTDGIGLTRYEPYKRKQGGKMFKFKKGNKIHIKKANRGKFTDYCGGEVTNECIQRGKHSSNPAVRKRATFAQNARHFKHKLGGVVKADDGMKFTINDGLTLGSQLIGNIANSIQQNKFIDSQIKANQAQSKYLQSQIWNNSLSRAKDFYTKQFEENQKKFNSGESFDNPSQIVAAHSAWDMASKDANNQINNLNNQLQLDNQQLQQQKKSILGSSLGIAGNFITNKFNNYDFS